ncbi:hypothetical protein GCM10007941_03250 [Amphritea balenae]|nr:TetR/AcrR family transcriptional regulator C-terminal domain-containing protein [Amphritea balenae]GGK56433.1 hypothetical protein GCM10007941_03250 [Amphritea balenae]
MKDPHMNSLVRVIFAECIHSPELISEALQQFQEQEQGLDSWIKAAIDDHKFRQTDPHYAAVAIYGTDKECYFLASTADESTITRTGTVPENH